VVRELGRAAGQYSPLMSKIVLVVLCLFALASCTPGATVAGFEAELKTAGYEVKGIEHDRAIGDGVLKLDLVMSGKPTDADWDKICKVAWTRYPDDIDELQLTVNGKYGLSMLDRELREAYGQHP
jgi:hypothetical protein